MTRRASLDRFSKMNKKSKINNQNMNVGTAKGSSQQMI